MPEWLVRLHGDPADLQEFADEFRSSQLSVRKEKDGYFLRSTNDFGALVDVDDVLARAAELLPLLTGIIKLRTGHTDPVTVEGLVVRINDNGTRVRFVALSGALRLVAKLRMATSGDTDTSEPPLAEQWLALAQEGEDTRVEDALRFFQEDTTWWGLRKAYEVMEGELKHPNRIAKLTGTTEDEIKQFKAWAGYYVHGQQNKPPDEIHNPRLPLSDAETFIQNLLLKWLHWKWLNWKAEKH